MPQIKGKECHFPGALSSWVHAFILTCDNQLAVWFKKSFHGRKIPENFVCLYPDAPAGYYDVAIVSDPGKFVHQFLYKKFAYQEVLPPALPCSPNNCGTVSTNCCPNNALPTTLYLTIVDVSGCACLAGTYTLTYDATSPGWFGTLAGVCGVASTNRDLELLCNGTMWGLTIQATGGSCFAGPVPNVDCSTPSWSISNAGISLPCCSGTVNITVTA